MSLGGIEAVVNARGKLWDVSCWLYLPLVACLPPRPPPCRVVVAEMGLKTHDVLRCPDAHYAQISRNLPPHVATTTNGVPEESFGRKDKWEVYGNA